MTCVTARRIAVTVFIALWSSGCMPDLPEPESPSAKLYVARCSSCHRLYAPTAMTAATWEVILKRMQGEMRRRGVAPLSTADSKALQAYLSRYALNSGARTPEDPS